MTRGYPFPNSCYESVIYVQRRTIAIMPFEKVSALSQVTFICARHPYLRASVTILDFILLNSTISRDELDRRIPVSCDAALPMSVCSSD